jgi:hypothetical protein
LGTLGGTTSNSSGGTAVPTNPVSTTGPSITPLNPNLTANVPGHGVTPVFLVPPPLQPLVVHLAPSSAPATNQSNSSLISSVEEQPAAITHFGQPIGFEESRFFLNKIEAQSRDSSGSSLIDFVEPFQPVAPLEAPKGDPAPAPDAVKVRTLPAISDPDVDAALGLTDARLMTRSHDGETAQPDDQLSVTSTPCNLSALFGAMTVATGGYHLVMRQADRFQGRWVPRWVGAERPTKRKTGAATC